ncbi:MAG TPA: DUF2959 family protein [Phycisphaerales bacterium]|nr:DUF2959 family protein [Phycisphaerales bacterium]
MIRRLILVLALGSVLPLASCVTDRQPARFDAFSRNRMEVLVRQVTSARDAHSAATDQIVDTLRAVRRKAWTGAEPQEAYDLVRRMLATCESRYHTAKLRRDRMEETGREFFDQWGREVEDYADETLRQESRRNLNDFKDRLKVVVRQMEQAEQEMDKVIGVVQDQMLFIKHHRTSAALPPRPGPEVEPVVQAETLVNMTGITVLRADDFISRAQVTK